MSKPDDNRENVPAEIRCAAAYVRTAASSPEGVEEQLQLNKARAASEGFVIPDDPEYQFVDDGVGGLTHQREGFGRLLAAVESGAAPFSRVYVRDRTRLGRWIEPRMGFYYEVLFESNGSPIRYSDDESNG